MLSTKRWRRWKRWNAIAQRIPGVRLRHVVLGCRFAAALLSRYWVQPSKRVLLVSATLSKRRCAPLMHNTRALSRRLPIGISTTQALQAFEQEHAADQGPHENGRRGRICREKPAQAQRRMMWIARMRL